MALPKRLEIWGLAVILSLALVLTTTPVRASDDRNEAPFMIMAAAFVTVMIIIAVNAPSHDSKDDSSSSTAAPTSSSSSALHSAAPRRGGPSPSAPFLGFRGHF